jgi:hypothetical protein
MQLGHKEKTNLHQWVDHHSVPGKIICCWYKYNGQQKQDQHEHLYYDSNTSLKPLDAVQINLTFTCKSLMILAEHKWIKLTGIPRKREAVGNGVAGLLARWTKSLFTKPVLSSRLQGTGREDTDCNWAHASITH